MSMCGMPQAENGGKMLRGTRKFTGASVMIGFVPIYALVAMALAQTDPSRHAPGLVEVLCDAALGMARIVPVVPLISWMERPNPGT
jgi:Protein of unknown function (DUF2842)